MSDLQSTDMAMRLKAWDDLWAILLRPRPNASDEEDASSVSADEAPIE
jgi:hypothetical protein